MNDIEYYALNLVRNNELAKLKKLPKETLNFKNNMLVYRAIADNKYLCFKYLISIKEIREIFDIKHAFLLTIFNSDSKILDMIIEISKETPIVLNQKDNTYLLEKLIKSKEDGINNNQELYYNYIDFENLLFSKKILTHAMFNKDLYYLNLMYQVNEEQFNEFCSNTIILQKAVNYIESKDFSFNNEIFKLNHTFYQKVLNYVNKSYRNEFFKEIKRKINTNLIQLNMEGF